MKLISMADKQEELEDYVHESHNYERAFKLASLHRALIKTPLELGQFIPVDEDGEPIQEPVDNSTNHDEWCVFHDLSNRYGIAQSKVLFKGVEIKFNDDCLFFITHEYGSSFFHEDNTIEDLLIPIHNLDLELTETAIKMIT